MSDSERNRDPLAAGEPSARKRLAPVLRLPRPEPESQLMPQDFDRALGRMKRDLALTHLRRRLLEKDLDAREVLALIGEIEALQQRS